MLRAGVTVSHLKQTRHNAAYLKKHFGAYGHFYRLCIGTDNLPCRSVLELTHHDITPLNLADLRSRQPDLLCTLMNPGSARPINDSYKELTIAQPSDIVDHTEYVAAVPDTTQYQVLRLLAHQGWTHARILNLSDLRNPKSAEFLDTIKQLAESDPTFTHSIFSPSRRIELAARTGNDTRLPVLLGWGRAAELKPMAAIARQALSGHRILGVSIVGEPLLYAHPSPMLQTKKDLWIDAIIQQLATLKT